MIVTLKEGLDYIVEESGGLDVVQPHKRRNHERGQFPVWFAICELNDLVVERAEHNKLPEVRIGFDRVAKTGDLAVEQFDDRH